MQLIDHLQEDIHELFDQLMKETKCDVQVLGLGNVVPAVNGVVPEEHQFIANSRSLETFMADIRAQLIEFVRNDNRFVPGAKVTRRMFSTFSPTHGANDGIVYKGVLFSLVYSVSVQ